MVRPRPFVPVRASFRKFQKLNNIVGIMAGTWLAKRTTQASCKAKQEQLSRKRYLQHFDISMEKGDIIISDGGMGHELKRRGISDGTFVAGALANEKYSNSDIVETIHREYIAAGCDVITTNSFVAVSCFKVRASCIDVLNILLNYITLRHAKSQVPRRMIECGLATTESDSNQRASQLIVAAVARARAAIAKHNENFPMDKCKSIAGCVPPLTECYLSYKVPSSVDCLMPEYGVIISTLLECNVDILLAETLSTAREAQAVLRSLHLIHQTGKHCIIPPLWISFTVHDDQPSKLRSDEPLDLVCQSILHEATALNLPLKALGINCSAPSAISQAVPILVKLVEGTDIKVCAYGNGFKTTTSEWMKTLNDNAHCNTACTTDQKADVEICAKGFDEDELTSDVFANYACEWARLGARIIGGCCGSSPKHMSAVATVLKDFV
jgi:homocysteine S-methyltransferase